MTTTDAPITPEGLDLFGKIVSQNVRDLAFTTDRLMESKEAQIKALAQTVVDIDSILSEATVIDRATEWRIAHLQSQIESAYLLLGES